MDIVFDDFDLEIQCEEMDWMYPFDFSCEDSTL